MPVVKYENRSNLNCEGFSGGTPVYHNTRGTFIIMVFLGTSYTMQYFTIIITNTWYIDQHDILNSPNLISFLRRCHCLTASIAG
jgi:hypothetical protein